MRVSREEAERNRKRVVDSAARLLREHGLSGISIAEIMKTCGLTHGGFYGQFASKEALAAEAIGAALAASRHKWEAITAGDPEGPVGALTESYLTARHRDQAGQGCALPALAADVAREGGEVSAAFTEGMRGLIDVLEAGFARDGHPARQAALATLAQLAGAVLLARAVDDPALSDEILSAARAAIAPDRDASLI